MRLFYFYFLLFASVVFGQNKELIKLSIEADSLESKNPEKSLLLREKILKNTTDKNYYYYKAKSEINKATIANNNDDLDNALKHIKLAFNDIPKFNSNPLHYKFMSEIYSDYYLTTSFLGNWEEASVVAVKGYEFTLKKLPKDKSLVFFALDIGYINKELRNYTESILYYEKSLKLAYKLDSKNYPTIALIHNGLGISYSDYHFHNLSLYHYEKELEMLKKAKQDDNSYLVQSLNNVIWENLSYGDQKKAENALQFLNSNFSKWYNEKEFSRINVPAGYKEHKEYFKMMAYLCNLRMQLSYKNTSASKSYYDSINYVFQKLPDDLKKRDYNVLMLAKYEYVKLFTPKKNTTQKSQKEHIEFNSNTLAFAKKYNSKYDELVAAVLLCNTYYNYEKYSEALKTIEEAKTISENFFNASRFTIQILEAMVLEKVSKQEKSKEVLKQAFGKLLDKKTKLNNLKNLSYADLKKFNSDTFLINILRAANLYESFYKTTKNKEDLIIANNLYFMASDMFAEFYQKGKYNYSLNKFNQEIASGLLQTQLLINPNDQKKLKEIINRIENNSSQHLWNIFEIKNNQNLKIPASLILKLNELVFEKNSIKEELEKNKESVDLKNKLASIEKNIAKIQTEINKKDQSYQKFKSADFSIAATQKKLSDKQLLIKYVVADKSVFAFSIKKESVRLINLGNANQLKKVVTLYNNQIKTIDNSFINSSKKLYSKLLQPLLKNESVTSLIFVPEDFLTTVSFESLQNTKEELLVQNFTSSYAYSIKLWDILKDSDKALNQNNNIVTFAPNYAKTPPKNQTRGLLRADLYDLVDAKKEARAISELLNGTLFENQEANRDNFLKSTTKYSLHHLAMHSQLEEDYSKSALVFADNKKVYFDELYELNFPSKLVVLSACNTGIGTNDNGDGLMSLSRALTYSGVKSSVYSLWQVPDKETSEIMISFYENLKKGQAKDEALANAKTTFIKNNPMKKHPFYWAGFVVNGDVSPIISSSNWMLYIGIGFGILLLLLIFRKKLF